MAEFTLSGRLKVKTLKAQFKTNFGATLRVYKSASCKGPFADDDATLASIRAEGFTGGDFTVKGNMLVGNFEKKVASLFGIGVQVASPDDKFLVNNSITLSASGKAESKKGEDTIDLPEETELVLEEETCWCDESRQLTDEEISWLEGKTIAVGFDYEAFEDSDIEWEDLCLTDGLDYRFRDGEVLYGNGFQSDNLEDIEIFEFSQDEELKDFFAKLYDDEERKVVNLVLNLINRQMDDFPDIAEAIVKSVPISSIIMYDEDDNPIVEACSINFNLDYFQSYI